MMTAYKTNLASIWTKTGNKTKKSWWNSFSKDLGKPPDKTSIIETKKWYWKTYQYRKSVLSSFPHERKWTCPGISVTSCSDSSLINQQISHNPFSEGLLWNQILSTDKNVVSKLQHTKALDPEIKNLKLPCGGTLEGQLHSHLHWRAMQSSLQDTWNGVTFYSFLLQINQYQPY